MNKHGQFSSVQVWSGQVMRACVCVYVYSVEMPVVCVAYVCAMLLLALICPMARLSLTHAHLPAVVVVEQASSAVKAVTRPQLCSHTHNTQQQSRVCDVSMIKQQSLNNTWHNTGSPECDGMQHTLHVGGANCSMPPFSRPIVSVAGPFYTQMRACAAPLPTPLTCTLLQQHHEALLGGYLPLARLITLSSTTRLNESKRLLCVSGCVCVLEGGG